MHEGGGDEDRRAIAEQEAAIDSIAVGRRLAISSGNLEISVAITACGEGATKGGTFRKWTSPAQIAISVRTPTAGRSRAFHRSRRCLA